MGFAIFSDHTISNATDSDVQCPEHFSDSDEEVGVEYGVMIKSP